MNPDVDGITITVNHQITLRKCNPVNPKSPENTPKNAKNNLLRTKKILKPKYK